MVNDEERQQLRIARAVDAIADEGVFSEDQIAALAQMISAIIREDE